MITKARAVLAVLALALSAAFLLPASASATAGTNIGDGGSNCLMYTSLTAGAAVTAQACLPNGGSDVWTYDGNGKISIGSLYVHATSSGFTLGDASGARDFIYGPGHVLTAANGQVVTWCGGTGTEPYLAASGGSCQETIVFIPA
jgi:hypothetical protein